MNMKKWIGLGTLALFVLGVAGSQMVDWESLKRDVPISRPAITVQLMYGGEKSAFLANPAVQDIFAHKYHLTLAAKRAGSIDMVTTADVLTTDCLWPSNQVAVELAKQNHKVLNDEIIFNSPIVFYTWGPVAEAFIKAGIVEERTSLQKTKTYYVINSQKLVTMIENGTTWESLGLTPYGSIAVASTDPTRSNSGNMWAAWLAIQMNGGKMVTESTLPSVLPRLRTYFGDRGLMATSSGDIFENFLVQGMGSMPIIVGYENQLPEFILSNPGQKQYIQDQIKVLYPEPTLFASHPLISLTPACGRLAEALHDPDIQAIAWRDHGFRTGLPGVKNDPALFAQMGMPENVDKVMPMPSAAVMLAVIDKLK